ncbi:MAG: hypothetical protein J2P47_01340 [Acetobacteraceae bacterium]|nr:hypothetical protein [Acetobacteraceae bacterium]
MPAVPGAVQEPSRIPTEAVALGSGAPACRAQPARALPGANGRVGSVGCGRQSLLFACGGARLEASVDCRGGPIARVTGSQCVSEPATPSEAKTSPARPEPPLERLNELGCPSFAVFGAEDQNPAADPIERVRREPLAGAEEMGARLTRAGKPRRIKLSQGAGYVFLADYRPRYREPPGAGLWDDLLVFPGEPLKPGAD